MKTPEEYIDIDGHNVPAVMADQFYDGRTGRRITDAEWDESRRRIREAEEAESNG